MIDPEVPLPDLIYPTNAILYTNTATEKIQNTTTETITTNTNIKLTKNR